MFDIPTTTYIGTSTVVDTPGVVDTLFANISSQFADIGTLAIIALAAGIPLAFYVIKRVIALIPKGR